MANIGVVRSITQVGTYEPFELQVSRGQITGHETVNVFGFATAVSSSFVAVWEVNGAYVFPTVASTMILTSSSASDTAVTVQIDGLDASYNRITENVTSNGTSGVVTTKVFWRINSVITVAGVAVGTLFIKNAGGTTYAQITIGNGRTNMGIYTVPAGYSFYLKQTDAWSSTSVTSGTFATYRTLIVSSTGISNIVLQAPFLNQIAIERPMPSKFPEKVDIQFQCKSSGSGLNIGTLAIGILIKDFITSAA
jgi:hypothetical protein